MLHGAHRLRGADVGKSGCALVTPLQALLLDKINLRLAVKAARVSRQTAWRWRSGDSKPMHDQAMVLVGLFVIHQLTYEGCFVESVELRA